MKPLTGRPQGARYVKGTLHLGGGRGLQAVRLIPPGAFLLYDAEAAERLVVGVELRQAWKALGDGPFSEALVSYEVGSCYVTGFGPLFVPDPDPPLPG